MTWTSVIWVFAGLFLLAFAGILALFLQHIGNTEDIANLTVSLFLVTNYTRAAYNILFWSAIYALIAIMPLTGLYALVVLIVKYLTK